LKALALYSMSRSRWPWAHRPMELCSQSIPERCSCQRRSMASMAGVALNVGRGVVGLSETSLVFLTCVTSLCLELCGDSAALGGVCVI
jgi:hypothetical protein